MQMFGTIYCKCNDCTLFIIVFLINVETLQEFLQDDFNVQQHTNQVMQSMAIAEQLSKLAEGISLLDKELHAQVRIHIQYCSYPILHTSSIIYNLETNIFCRFQHTMKTCFHRRLVSKH